MIIVKAKSINYAQIIYEWLDVKKGEVDEDQLKEQTYIKYYDIVKRVIIPKLGNESFNKLNNKTVENFFNNEDVNSLALSSQKNSTLYC